MRRHLVFFNTHPYVAAAIVGGVLYHEQRIARGRGDAGPGGGLQGRADGAAGGAGRRLLLAVAQAGGGRAVRGAGARARAPGRRCSSWSSTTSCTSPCGRGCIWLGLRAGGPAGGGGGAGQPAHAGARGCGRWRRPARAGWRPGWRSRSGRTQGARGRRCSPGVAWRWGCSAYLLVGRRVPSYAVLYVAAALAVRGGSVSVGRGGTQWRTWPKASSRSSTRWGCTPGRRRSWSRSPTATSARSRSSARARRSTASRIMGVLMLAAAQGMQVKVTLQGRGRGGVPGGDRRAHREPLRRGPVSRPDEHARPPPR